MTTSFVNSYSYPNGSIADAVAVADFVAGTYTVDGAGVALATIIDQPGKVGASGLAMDTDTNGDVKILGGLLAKLIAAPWTIVLEWDDAVGSGTLHALVIESAGYDYTDLYSFGGNDFAAYDAVAAGDRSIFIVNQFDPLGRNRMAFTRTAAKISASINGVAASTVAAPKTLATMTKATFGGFEGGPTLEGFIRKFYVLPVRPDIDLAALSAL